MYSYFIALFLAAPASEARELLQLLKLAFDSVPHNKLFEVLYRTGISVEIIRILQNLYSKVKMKVKIDDSSTSEIEMALSLMKGEPTSSILFVLYVADFELFIKMKGFEGINLDGIYDLLSLFLPDDIYDHFGFQL